MARNKYNLGNVNGNAYCIMGAVQMVMGQELMRHSSIDTLFDHYAHVLRSDLAEAVERI